MDEMVVLDAVNVATIARAARDLPDGPCPELDLLPEPLAAELRKRTSGPLLSTIRDVLREYAGELDEIADAAVLLDQNDHEIEHQLRWWGDRAVVLEARLTGNPADDVDTVRELALFRGRISGAHTMRKHYHQQRTALVGRHRAADDAVAVAISLL